MLKCAEVYSSLQNLVEYTGAKEVYLVEKDSQKILAKWPMNSESIPKISNCAAYSVDTEFGYSANILLYDSIKNNFDICMHIRVLKLILEKNYLREELNSALNSCDSDESSRDLFLASMSHEIRTPLNGVIGYSQLLTHTELSREQKEYVNNMNQCAVQLLQIVNDILDFSKLATGKMMLAPECTAMKDLESMLNSLVKQWISNKKQMYEFVVADNTPDFIVVDSQKVIQILVNLISNASKFTGIGGKITVSVKTTFDGLLQFSVIDTGIGISDIDQLKLFHTFSQLRSSPERGRGVGLGLAICKSLTELLGGVIRVSSVPNFGSTFSFTIKYESVTSINGRIAEDSRKLEGMYVLVVDDNEDNRILLSEMLFRWGMHPIVCASALEALRLVMKDRYEFVIGLIDICMPSTSGPDLAAQLKEEKPMFPLIALSSADDSFHSHHFERILRKPVAEEVLFDAVLRVVGKSKRPSAYIGRDDELSDTSSTSPVDKFNKSSRILVAEDHPHNRDLLVSMLVRLGYKDVQTADNGREAIDVMERAKIDAPFDVLLLDLRMPNMDGYQVIEEIRNRKWRIPKIVVVSASVLDCDTNRCAKLGIKYFVRKPIQLSELGSVIMRVTVDD